MTIWQQDSGSGIRVRWDHVDTVAGSLLSKPAWGGGGREGGLRHTVCWRRGTDVWEGLENVGDNIALACRFMTEFTSRIEKSD